MKTPMKANGSGKSEQAAGPLRIAGDRLTLNLHVQPGARTTAWAGRHGDALKLRIAARAVDGLANQACVAFLAESTGVSRAAVALVHGEKSRSKLFRIDGVAPDRIQTLIEACGL
jgi:uncharacterized protein (TIGR00251 family)